jgi:uncharacterized membrane protein YqjE
MQHPRNRIRQGIGASAIIDGIDAIWDGSSRAIGTRLPLSAAQMVATTDLTTTMSIYSKITRWRNVGQFCTARVGDYGALFLIELSQTKAKVMRELIAMVALAVGVLFTLSFLCFAVIATAWQTPYFLVVVWGIAGLWLLISIAAFLVVRTQKPTEPFKTLHSEIQSDMAAVKEALK